MRRYELRFVTERGRIIRGPIVRKKGHTKMKDFIMELNDLNYMSMTFGRRVSVVPKGTIQKGHAEIKPVGALYSWFRIWRSR